MNERIRELWDPAANASAAYPSGQNTSWETQVIFMKKFAELIIRECCGVLTENVEVALDASGSPVYPEGLIYEHFGVEE